MADQIATESDMPWRGIANLHAYLNKAIRKMLYETTVWHKNVTNLLETIISKFPEKILI